MLTMITRELAPALIFLAGEHTGVKVSYVKT